MCNMITLRFTISPVTSAFTRNDMQWHNFLVASDASLMTVDSSHNSYSGGEINLTFYQRRTLQNRSMTFTPDFSKLHPTSNMFSLTTAAAFSFVVSPTNAEAQLECCHGYQINLAADTCDEICGDGLLFELPCDDNNTISLDGCSDSCTIEQYYVCVNGTTTTPSVCSYNASINFEVEEAFKHPTSNSITLTYDFSPVEPVLALMGGNDIASSLSFNNPTVNITSAVYHPESGKVTI